MQIHTSTREKRRKSRKRNLPERLAKRRLSLKAGMMLSLFLVTQQVYSAQIRIDEEKWLNVGFRLQSWAQWVEKDAAGKNSAEDRIDFQVRRAYFYVGGQVHPQLQYFAHIAGDRLGQAGLDNPGNGAGTGFALRDAWVMLNLADELRLQLGRMYAPFTRGFGTEATFALQTLDIAQYQQGNLIPGRRVGRDDGVAVWGNLIRGRLQYRLALMDGADRLPEAGLRFAGRIALSLFAPETDWFNLAAHLNGKRVLSAGVGFDRLSNFNEEGKKHSGWTTDVYFALPMGKKLIFIGEGAYAAIDQDDTLWTGDYLFGALGIFLERNLLFGPLHPYVRYERFDVDENVKNPPQEKSEWSVGLNFYPRNMGHAFKTTVDWTHIQQRKTDSFNRLTTQLQLSF
jgi:hypothetical protein